MARQVKTLFNNPNERNHRDHRSKKNRVPLSKTSLARSKEFKLKKEKLKLKELDNEIKQQI